jgi:acyl-coenzyme A thioesterase PaaI-like protein
MNVKPEFFHAGGAVHGSVYFKALDEACFFAVNSLVEDVFVLTTQFNLYLLSPIQQGKMIAKGRVLDEQKSSFIAESYLMDQEGQTIARGSGIFVKSKIKLDESIKYQ